MNAQANEFPVKKMSEVFGVSRSGYYEWKKQSFERSPKKQNWMNKLRLPLSVPDQLMEVLAFMRPYAKNR